MAVNSQLVFGHTQHVCTHVDMLSEGRFGNWGAKREPEGVSPKNHTNMYNVKITFYLLYRIDIKPA